MPHNPDHAEMSAKYNDAVAVRRHNLQAPQVQDILNFEARFEAIYGPAPAGLADVSRAIRRNAYGVTASKCPAGFFILAGPSGAGKTFFAQTVAKALHNTLHDHSVFLNGADFAEETDYRKLVGSPPGYMGHRETPPVLNPGVFSAARSNTSGLAVIIFDEIELLHYRVSSLFRAALDENNGAIILGDNTRLSFTNTLIFATTNIGAAEESPLGLHDTSSKAGGIKSLRRIEELLVKKFGRAEFNRMRQLGGVMEFPRFSVNQMRDIIRRRAVDAVRIFNKSPIMTAKIGRIAFKDSWLDQFMAKYRVSYGVRDGLAGVTAEVTDVLLPQMLAHMAAESVKVSALFENLGEVDIEKV